MRKAHHHLIIIARLNHLVVTDRSAWLRDVLHTRTMCTFNVVSEREERVASQGNTRLLIQPCPLFCLGENARLF